MHSRRQKGQQGARKGQQGVAPCHLHLAGPLLVIIPVVTIVPLIRTTVMLIRGVIGTTVVRISGVIGTTVVLIASAVELCRRIESKLSKGNTIHSNLKHQSHNTEPVASKKVRDPDL